VSLVGQDEFKTFMKQTVSEVKEILLGYPSDYGSEPVEQLSDSEVRTCPIYPIAWIGRVPVTISNSFCP
jgi:hypothetical protein